MTATASAPQASKTSSSNQATPQFPVTRTPNPRPKPADEGLGFGTAFTDHMFMMDYVEGAGWHEGRIEPYGTIPMDPAAAVLHYAQAVFDGLKAFRGVDGKIRVFRPDKHVARLISSCERMCIPEMDHETTLQSLLQLVRVEKDWVPRAPGTALYLRPTIVATEAFLGVRPAKEYVYFVICSPVGAYYKEGFGPVKIRVAEDHVRAVEGGVGAAKTGANYAASLYAAEQAKHEGYAQVLWLDGRERKYLDEVGTMNLMLRIGDEVVTPPLGGTILPGVTRDSALTLLRDWGIPVAERRIAMDEVLEAADNGTLQEVWGTGTAAVISPVGELKYQDRKIEISGGQPGELTQRLYKAITAIQYGEAPDPHGWTREV
jgi:branched-chain amino acid aminotransferase